MPLKIGNNPGQLLSPTPTTSGPTTASASYADLAEMDTGNFTTRGGRLLCTFEGVFQHTTATAAETFGFSLDAATEVGDHIFQAAAANVNESRAMQWVFTGVAAGSHRIKVRWKTGGATLTGWLLERSLTVQELPY